jgi:hypothetical protein
MYKVSVVTDDGVGLIGENCTYSLDSDSANPVLIVTTEDGTNFFNWAHVVYFGTELVGA